MPITKVLARGWKLEVNTALDNAPVWIRVGGVNSFTFSNSKDDADTTDFDSDGYLEHMVANRGFEISAEGFYLVDKTTAARDAGQEYVEGLNEKMGSDSLGQFRIISPAGTIKIFKASVGLGDIGGGNDDPTSWSCTLTVSGKPTTA